MRTASTPVMGQRQPGGLNRAVLPRLGRVVGNAPAREFDAESLLDAYAGHVRRGPGAVHFPPFRDVQEPCRFSVFESCETASAFNDHLASPCGHAFNTGLALLAEGGGSTLHALRPLLDSGLVPAPRG